MPKLDPATAAQRASFATTARLFSCLVTESLVRALYVPLEQSEAITTGSITGACVIFNGNENGSDSQLLAVIPLRHVPVFKHEAAADTRGREIGLLDPMDMMPLVYHVHERNVANGAAVPKDKHADLTTAITAKFSSPAWSSTFRSTPILLVSNDPIPLWHNFAAGIQLEHNLTKDIADELASAVLWQTYSYEHPPRAPTLEDPSIDWEQSIVEGHPTHPMHKTRAFLPPIPPIAPGAYDLYNPSIRLIVLPRHSLKITGPFVDLTKAIRDAAEKRAGRKIKVAQDEIVVPVHELQVWHVREKFPEARIMEQEFNVPARAQQSIRSVILPGTLKETSLKLGVGIKLTSAVRTISPASAFLGPRFSSAVVPHLTYDRKILTVARELASVVHVNEDGEVAKHCAAIVRECWENLSEDTQSGKGRERHIVCTSLVESGHEDGEEGVQTVVRVFGLDTEAKRLRWLDDFVRLFYDAFLPPMLHNGVGFEAHPQNTILRVSLDSSVEPQHKLLGFIIRDFGGLRIHTPTLLSSTHPNVTTPIDEIITPGHSILADTLDDVYTRMYHTVVHNHFQQLVRVLGLHYNGKGWEIVRERLKEALARSEYDGKAEGLREAWFGSEGKERWAVPGKCFMRMRMVGMYRHHLHEPFPNLLYYKGSEAEQS